MKKKEVKATIVTGMQILLIGGTIIPMPFVIHSIEDLFVKTIIVFILFIILMITISAFIDNICDMAESNADESLILLHIIDKDNKEDVELKDLVNCLEEKGFLISEYFAIRRILFDRTESQKYHSIFQKVEKLMKKESKE